MLESNKGKDLLKIQFATWYEMTAPLVFFATERGKGKGDNGTSKEGSDDDTEIDYRDEDDKDSGMELQDAQTQRICKRKNKTKEGERTKMALATERCKKRKKSLDKYG